MLKDGHEDARKPESAADGDFANVHWIEEVVAFPPRKWGQLPKTLY